MDSKKFWVAVGVVSLFISGAVSFGPAIIEEVAFAVEKGKTSAAREQLAELSRHDKLSPLFVAVSKAVKPSVVVVRTVHKIRMPQMTFPGFPFGFGRPMPRQGQPFQYQRGQGSGVIVDAKNGYVLTNHHVVGNAEKVEVILADGRKLKAEWVRTDSKTDLAVVKIPAEKLIASPLGNSDKVEVGQWVLAIGAPMGLPQTVTSGIISAKGRVTSSRGNAYQNFLQTDAAINRGNSGGPLVNTRGEVIGINSMILSSTGMNAGIGLSIPSNMARNIMRQLIDNGRVVRGYLGVHIQDVDERLAKSFKLPNGKGALVTGVLPGSPAAKAGLKPEDFITAVNGKALNNTNDLRNSIAAIAPGKEAKLDIYRDGKKQQIKLKIGHLPGELATADKDAEDDDQNITRKLGFTISTMTDELAKTYGYEKVVAGALITAVLPGSDAANVGLQRGMVITHVNGKAVATDADFRKAAAKAGSDDMRLRVTNRQGGTWYLILSPGK